MTETIIQIISEIKDDRNLLETLNGQSNIIEETGMDSLQLVKFILRIEDEFNTEIDFEEFDLAHLNSIEEFLEFLVAKR